MNDVKKAVMTNWRWVMCAMLFFATTVNYMDRQVLSLTFKEFIQPEFHWTDNHYGTITGVFSIAYAIFCLFAGKFIDWMGRLPLGDRGMVVRCSDARGLWYRYHLVCERCR